MMAGLLQDIRYGLRAMRKAPGFSATTIVTLALAIGVTTAVFSVIDAVLIRPLPYDHPERILYLRTNSPQGYTQPAAYPEYLDWRRGAQSFPRWRDIHMAAPTLRAQPAQWVCRTSPQPTASSMSFACSLCWGAHLPKEKTSPGRTMWRF